MGDGCYEVVRDMYQAEEMQQAGLVIALIMAEPNGRAMYSKLARYADVY